MENSHVLLNKCSVVKGKLAIVQNILRNYI